MLGLASARPAGTVLAHDIFTLSCDLIFKRKPCHEKDNEPSVLIKYAGKLRCYLIVIEIPEALACRYHIKRTGRKIQLFRRYGLIFYIHAGFFRKKLCLFYLLGRYVSTYPFCSELIHVARQHARTCSKVQNSLTLNAQTPVSNFSVEFLRINIPVLGICF